MSLPRFNPGAWEWPDTLAPLMQWAERRNIDVYSFKSARQALYLIKGVSRQKVKHPKHGQSCIPQLVKMQKTLCPKGSAKGESRPSRAELADPNAITRIHGLGTFGAADAGRRVSIEEYMREKELAR